MAPEPVNPLIEQFTRVTSAEVKFVLDSVNTTVTAIAPATGLPAVELKVAVGGVMSAVRDNTLDAIFPLPAASVNAPPGTCALKRPSAKGLSVKP